MKKHFLITLLLMAFAMAATAQNKKIAILETVDKKGNVPYGILLQLRSNLTYAISSTPGYEGYDRVDMAQIMGEHDFQRTGLVSDEQIRRLGEMTGASSILVAEAAFYDKDNIIITAKILNVETASVERSVPPQISGINPREMQEACEELADKLLVKAPIIPEELESVVIVEEQKVEPTVEKVLITKGEDFYYIDGQRISNEQYLELIKNCPEAWAKYEKGLKQKKTGSILIISGLSLVGIGTGLIISGALSWEWEGLLIAGLITAPVGAVTALGAIPIKIAGKSNLKKADMNYNQYCAQPKATLGFYPTANGIGMCLNF